MNTPDSELCSTYSQPCVDAGVYSANASSSYNYVASDFNISYVDGSGARGDYVTDMFSVENITLKSLQFGVGYQSSSLQGILGIGYAINEVQVGRAGKKPYANLPMKMVEEGLIRSNAYSLWLNDLDASTGNILFGGVDTAQYVGSLYTLPIQKSSGSFSEFFVTLTDLSMGNKSIAKEQAHAVLLDSGSSLTYLPDSMTEVIYRVLGAKYDDIEGATYVPCQLAQSHMTIDFKFSQPIIKVEMNELVIPISDSSSKPITFADGNPACLFGIAPAGAGTSVLGDTFLRSAYLVYDLDNNQISIAQTNFNTTDHNILEIGTGRNSVPDALFVEKSVTAKSGIIENKYSQSSSSRSATISKKRVVPFLIAIIFITKSISM